MASAPLPLGYSGIDDLPKQRQMLINCFNMDGSIVRSPGIDSVITATGTGCRGAATWALDGKAYFVIGSALYRRNTDNTRTSLGAIAGTAAVVISPGQVQIVILVVGGNSYTYSDADGLEQIVNSNFVTSVSVDFIDGRHVFIPADGSPAFFSEVDDAGNINALSFFDAEELPDINKWNINVRNLMYIMGSDSTEIFGTTGEVTAPFSRRSGSRVDVGYASGGIRYGNTFAFIGRARSQAYDFFIMATGDAQSISNPVVAEDLAGYTQDEIEACVANRFKYLGKEFLAWTFADKTYVFCDGNWFFMDSEIDGSNTGPWRVNGVAFADGNYYVGDLDSANMGKLSNSPSEYGLQVEYQIDTFLRAPRGTHQRPSMIEVDVLSGQDATTLGISLSLDGRIKSPYSYRSLGSTGEYQKRVRWRPSGGLGKFESFMGISIRGTGSVHFSAEAIDVS
jgi:hypothetical protein